jgi:hypothetical protein
MTPTRSARVTTAPQFADYVRAEALRAGLPCQAAQRAVTRALNCALDVQAGRSVAAMWSDGTLTRITSKVLDLDAATTF